MDNEMDLMLSKKSYVMETAKQEFRMPEQEVPVHEEVKTRELKLGQMMENTSHQKKVSLDELARSLKEEPKDMELIRQKGRIFMRRYETRSKINNAYT